MITRFGTEQDAKFFTPIPPQPLEAPSLNLLQPPQVEVPPKLSQTDSSTKDDSN